LKSIIICTPKKLFVMLFGANITNNLLEKMIFKISLDWERERSEDPDETFFGTELEITLNEQCNGIRFQVYQTMNDERHKPNLQSYGSFLGLNDVPEGISLSTYYNLICESFTSERYIIGCEMKTTFDITISLEHDTCKEIIVTMYPQLGSMFQDIAYDLRSITLVFRDILLGAMNRDENIERLKDQLLNVMMILEKKFQSDPFSRKSQINSSSSSKKC
jgi:hypothetical protein